MGDQKMVLITGGAGFIGSNLALHWVEQGHRVIVIDNLSTGREENLSGFRSRLVDFIQGDINEDTRCEAIFQTYRPLDGVFHLAARPSVIYSVEHPWESHIQNADATLKMLLWAKKYQVGKFFYASSSSVYGNTPTLPKHEAMPLCPLSPYAIGKLTGEYYVRLFHELYGLKTLAFRLFNVFGPRQNPDSPYAAVIPKFIKLLGENRPLTIYGDGRQTRDFTYVADVLYALDQAWGAPDSVWQGEVFNIACQRQVTVLDLAKTLCRLAGRPERLEFLPARSGEVQHSLASIDRACEALGYHPHYSLEKALAETLHGFDPYSSR